MQKSLPWLKAIGIAILTVSFVLLSLWAITSRRTEQNEKEKQRIIRGNEKIVPANLEFWEDETNKNICWKRCDYMRGVCNVEICSTGQMLALDCGGYQCWLK
jgi:hypothetical protein